MLTPQEVSNRAFSKAVMGGYNMAMVDEFLDELTDDYTALYKENAALKAKMKILVDKVEEYRSTEDSMRAALLTAQKMATTMVSEAEQQKNAILADAQAEARRKIGALQDEIAQEERRLNAAKAATADFAEQVRSIYERGMKFLEELPELEQEPVHVPVKEQVVHEETDVNEIEAKILASFTEKEMPPVPEAPKVTEEEPVSEDAEEGNPFVDTGRHLKLSELKFGRNYRSEE